MTRVLVDIETIDPSAPNALSVTAVVELPMEYELEWIDAALHDAPPPADPKAFERQRRFKHIGATIAWGRRKIFHGAVFGDAIDLVPVRRTRDHTGVVRERREDPFEMTLKGFSRWGDSYSGRLSLGHTTRKCRIAD